MKKNSLQIDRKLIARKRAETRLKIYGIVSISIALIMLSTLIISIGLSGYSALQQAYVKLDIIIEGEKITDENGMFSNKKALLFNWDGAVSKALLKKFPSVKKRSDKKSLRSLMSSNAGFELREYYHKNPQDFDKKITLWLTASDVFDQYLKGRFNVDVLEKDRLSLIHI